MQARSAAEPAAGWVVQEHECLGGTGMTASYYLTLSLLDWLLLFDWHRWGDCNPVGVGYGGSNEEVVGGKGGGVCRGV